MVTNHTTNVQIWIIFFIHDYKLCSPSVVAKHMIHLTPEEPGSLSLLQGHREAMLASSSCSALAVSLLCLLLWITEKLSIKG